MAITLLKFRVYHFPHGNRERVYFDVMLNPKYIIQVKELDDHTIIEYDKKSTVATYQTEEKAGNILYRVNNLSVHDHTTPQEF